MNVIKNMFLCIGLSFLIPQHQTYAINYPLSQQSKNSVAISSGIGALIAGGIAAGLGFFIASLDDDINIRENKSTFGAIVSVCAAIGAFVAGSSSYYNTPEKTLEWVEVDLDNLENNILKVTVDEVQGISEKQACESITSIYWDSAYPAVSSVYKLGKLHVRYEDLARNLIHIKNCRIMPMCQIAAVYLANIRNNQENLKRAIILIKNKGNYAQELAAKQKAEYMVQMAAHQEKIVQAQLTQAQAALIQASKPPVTVVNQATPQIVINNHVD